MQINIQTVARELIKGSTRQVGGIAFAAVFELLQGSGNDEQLEQLQAALQELQAEVSKLGQRLESIESLLLQVLNQLDWNTLVLTINDPIARIESQFSDLAELSRDDSTSIQLLEQSALAQLETDLRKIHEAILPGLGGLLPTSQGLLGAYASANAMACPKDPAYRRGDFFPGSAMARYAQQLETYFLYLIGMQTKGYLLLISAYTASSEADLAQRTMLGMQERFTLQGRQFISGTELFTVACCPDITLLELLDTPAGHAISPIRRADILADAVSARQTLRMRCWGGSASLAGNPFPAAIGNPLNQGLVPTLGTLRPDSYEELPGQFTSFDPTRFPFLPSGVPTWTLCRYTWTDPPKGSYSLMLGTAPMSLPLVATLHLGLTTVRQPLYNAMLAPYELRNRYTTLTGDAKFTFDDQVHATDYDVAFVPRGQLSVPGAGSGLQPVNYHSAQHNPGKGPFSVEAWIRGPKPLGGDSQQVNPILGMIASTKSSFGRKDNAIGAWGASGFLLEVSNDGQLVFTVDDGRGYYQILGAAVPLKDDHWHHVAAVRQSTGLVLYLDGQPLSCQVRNNRDLERINLDDCWGVMVGCMNGNNQSAMPDRFSPATSFQGFISEVRVWNRALQPQEVTRHMYQRLATGQPQSDPSLFAALSLEDTRLQGTFATQAAGSASLSLATGMWFPPPLTVPPEHVVFRDVTQGVQGLSRVGNGTWRCTDLSGLSQAPAAAGAPWAFAGPAGAGVRAVFRAGDGSLRELVRGSDGSWTCTNISSLGTAPEAAGDPRGFAWAGDNGEHVVFRGKEAALHDLNKNPNQDWKCEALTPQAALATDANPFPYTWTDQTSAHVVYRDPSGNIQELWRLPGDQTWSQTPISAQARAPKAVGDPRAYTDSESERVVFRGEGGSLYELKFTRATGWRCSPMLPAVPARVPGEPWGYIGLDGQSHVVYRGINSSIFLLACQPDGTWTNTNLTQATGAPAPGGDPRGYVFAADASENVVYVATDGSLHQLSRIAGGQWRHLPLSLAAQAPQGVGDPTACAA